MKFLLKIEHKDSYKTNERHLNYTDVENILKKYDVDISVISETVMTMLTEYFVELRHDKINLISKIPQFKVANRVDINVTKEVFNIYVYEKMYIKRGKNESIEKLELYHAFNIKKFLEDWERLEFPSDLGRENITEI